MGYVSEEILRTNIPCTVLSEAEAQKYRARIEDFGGSKWWPIWDYLESTVSIRDPEGWLIMREALDNKPALLFFNPQDESAIFRFKHSRDIVDVIAECTGFEYHVADEAIS